MDYRIVAVILPILLALSWAGYNIARAALGQLQLALRDFKKNTGN
ncbi:photosystem II protein Y [Synechococcus sp. N19]|jgi:photosystem II PsbY protein|nr:photosystem II protein Y [Synechococcus sp. N19]